MVRRDRDSLAAAIQAAIIALSYTVTVALSGGVQSLHAAYAPLMPMLAGFLSGKRMAWATAIFIGLFFAASLLVGPMAPDLTPKAHSDALSLVELTISLLAAGFLTSTYETVTRRSEKQLEVTIAALSAAKDEASAAQSFLDTVLANIPLAILVKDYKEGGRYSLINACARSLLGPAAGDMLGKTNSQLVPAEQAAAFAEADREIFAAKHAKFIDREDVPFFGGVKAVRTWLVPTFDGNGKPQLMIRISQDLTAELATKHALEHEQALRQQSAKLALLGEMAAGVAHEVNNPLAIVLGSARMLTKFIDKPERFPAYIRTIEGAGARIQKIVSGLKKFSRNAEIKDYRPNCLARIAEDVLALTSAS